jgi:magnesium transporter
MQTIKAKNLTWIDIRDPRTKDLKWLKENFDLHPLILKELLPPLDYPKVEAFDKYLFVVLFYPFFDKKTLTSRPLELDIIVSKNWIITSHYKNIVPLKAIFDKCNLYDEIREEYLDEGPSEPLYRIINEILLACFPKLSHIKHNIDAIEKAVFERKHQKTVGQISLVKRDIIGFQRILEPHKLLLEDMATKAPKIFNKKISRDRKCCAQEKIATKFNFRY